MENIFNDISTFFIIYGPVILTYLVQIIDWTIIINKLKKVDVKEPISKATQKINTKLADAMKSLEELTEFNKKCMEELKVSKEEHSKIHDDMIKFGEEVNAKIAEQNEIILNLIEKNIELEKQLRSKEA